MAPEKGETCVRCRRVLGTDRQGYVRSLIGPLCRACWRAANPESAPYWQEWEHGAAKERRKQARKRYPTPPMEVQ